MSGHHTWALILIFDLLICGSGQHLPGLDIASALSAAKPPRGYALSDFESRRTSMHHHQRTLEEPGAEYPDPDVIISGK